MESENIIFWSEMVGFPHFIGFDIDTIGSNGTGCPDLIPSGRSSHRTWRNSCNTFTQFLRIVNF